MGSKGCRNAQLLEKAVASTVSKAEPNHRGLCLPENENYQALEQVTALVPPNHEQKSRSGS
jgi:hypothetical protein